MKTKQEVQRKTVLLCMVLALTAVLLIIFVDALLNGFFTEFVYAVGILFVVLIFLAMVSVSTASDQQEKRQIITHCQKLTVAERYALGVLTEKDQITVYNSVAEPDEKIAISEEYDRVRRKAVEKLAFYADTDSLTINRHIRKI